MNKWCREQITHTSWGINKYFTQKNIEIKIKTKAKGKTKTTTAKQCNKQKCLLLPRAVRSTTMFINN